MRMSAEHERMHRLLLKWGEAENLINDLKEKRMRINEEINYDDEREKLLDIKRSTDTEIGDLLEFDWNIKRAVAQMNRTDTDMIEEFYKNGLEEETLFSVFGVSRSTFYRTRKRAFDRMTGNADLTEYLEELKKTGLYGIDLSFL